MVLDEIRRKQWSPAGVQRLEDDLRVVTAGQIDRDDYEQLPQDRGQCVEPGFYLSRRAALHCPFADSLTEPSERLQHPMVGLASVAVSDGLPKGVLIRPSGQHLESIVRLLDEEVVVEQQLLEHLSRLRKVHFEGKRSRSGDEQLQGRESLLTVNHVSRFDHAGRHEDLIEYHRAHEVRDRVVGRRVI